MVVEIVAVGTATDVAVVERVAETTVAAKNLDVAFAERTVVAAVVVAVAGGVGAAAAFAGAVGASETVEAVEGAVIGAAVFDGGDDDVAAAVVNLVVYDRLAVVIVVLVAAAAVVAVAAAQTSVPLTAEEGASGVGKGAYAWAAWEFLVLFQHVECFRYDRLPHQIHHLRFHHHRRRHHRH